MDTSFSLTMANWKTGAKVPGPKLDSNGNYLPFPGYTIVAHTIHPLPKLLTDLVHYLSSSELRNYYSFLPPTSYHVTINPLGNVRAEHQSLLRTEQQRLRDRNTAFTCTAQRLLYPKGILIEMQFLDDDQHTFESTLRDVRSEGLRHASILRTQTLPWHLTLAYRYKEFENEDKKAQLDQIIAGAVQSIASPFPIPLDQIRICHYDDMTAFTPIE